MKLDVRLTADGRLAVWPDETVERDGGCELVIAQTALAELPSRILTLEHALAFIVTQYSRAVNIEIKNSRGRGLLRPSAPGGSCCR